MSSALRPHISDAERRARLMRRHRLADDSAAATPVDVAESMVGLHATTWSTVYLSTWARMPDFVPADLDSDFLLLAAGSGSSWSKAARCVMVLTKSL